jgi:hypothetical protein
VLAWGLPARWASSVPGVDLDEPLATGSLPPEASYALGKSCIDTFTGTVDTGALSASDSTGRRRFPFTDKRARGEQSVHATKHQKGV